MSRVWKVETNGNQDKNAIGMKINIPIPASYRRAIERMDFHNPIRFITGFQADAIWQKENEIIILNHERNGEELCKRYI